MKRTFLLPHRCKIAGWIVMVPLVIVWLLYWLDNIEAPLMNFPPFGDGLGNLGKVGKIAGTIVDHWPTAYIIAIAASMMMVAFSRERDEDEYVASVRMKSLMISFWVDFTILAIATVTIYNFDYLYVMSTQMFLVLFLHIAIFNISMAVIRRRRGHEE